LVRRGWSWSEEQKLLAGDGAPGDLFGDWVAVTQRGDAALVGADGKDGTRGGGHP
jgi:hypothetical protein